MQSILITGASGFVGSHLVEAALEAGYEVWAGLRNTSSRQWLTDERIHFITLTLTNYGKLSKELETFAQDHGNKGWDYVVHVAGATKAPDEAAFFQANCDATRFLAKALTEQKMEPRRFVLMSSLCADREKDGGKLSTAYGRSKAKAEACLQAFPLESVILRPTGIYGPREKDYFLMVKSIKRHIDFAVGYKRQYITFIYIKDLCAATLLALEKGKSGAVYTLSDGATYSSRDFSNLLQKAMGVKHVVHLTAPLWMLRIVCCVGQWIGNITHSMTALNKDKYNILKQRDWRCSIEHAKTELGYSPCYDLQRGVGETVAWYKTNKWI